MINSEIQEVRAKKRGLELELAEFQKEKRRDGIREGRRQCLQSYLHQMRVMFPPCTTGNSAGRPVLELVHRLIARTSHPTPFERHSDSVCVCSNPELSFKECAVALPRYCEVQHSVSSDCKDCKGLQAIACAVLDNGFVRLS